MSNFKKSAHEPIAISDPVNAATGRLMEYQLDFLIPGLLPIFIDRTLHYKKDYFSPIGNHRFCGFDCVIRTSQEDPYTLIYINESGREIHFNRPVPSPGAFEKNSFYKNLIFEAGHNKTLIVKNNKLKTIFNKYSDGYWRINKIVDNNNNFISHVRDKNGLLLSIIRSDGIKLEFINDAKGMRRKVILIGVNGGRREIISYSYDEKLNLVGVFNKYGKDEIIKYDNYGNIIAWQRGLTSGRHEYDTTGRVVQTHTNGAYDGDHFEYDKNTLHFFSGHSDVKKTEFHCDDRGRIIRIEKPLNIVTSVCYDEDDYKISESNGEGEVAKFRYDLNGNLSSYIDGMGREWIFSYNEFGDIEYEINPLGNSWQNKYDEIGNLIAIINPYEQITVEFTYDEKGRPKGAMRSDGLLTTWQYNDHDHIISISDFNGKKTLYNYDEFGRLTEIITPETQKLQFFYSDENSNSFWQSSQVIRPDGVKLFRRFDQGNQTLLVIDGEGREVTYRYGPFDLLESIEDAKGNKIEFNYDEQEKLTSVTNQLDQNWIFERDAAGRVVKEIDFAGVTQVYTYDKADRITALQYSNGAKLTFSYDKSGLLLEEHTFAENGFLQDKTIYHYNAAGFLQRTENNSAVVEFTYDKYGRISREKLNGRAVENIYDCCGSRIGRMIGENFVKTLYNPMGRFSELTIGDHAALKMTLDPLGRELKRESAAGFVLNQSYDVLGQLKSQIGGFAIASLGRGLEGAMAAQKQGIDPSKATSQVERHFNWNKSFEPLAIDDKRWGNTSYNYDANGQIVESSSNDGTVERFRYDSALNINGFSGGNAADTAKFEQWLSRQGGAISEAKGPNGERVHLTYDSRNRVIERRVEKNGFRIKIWKYQWDAKDRLIGCTTPTGERWTYHYDPFGRRIFKINASIAQKALLAQSPNVTELEKNRGAYHEDNHQRGSGDMSEETIVGTAYLWDANTIAEEAPLKASGEADWDKATKWHYEPDTFRPIAKETENGELFYIVNDHLGTPREMFSEDGKLVWAAQYRTWGAVHKIWQADNDNDIRGPYPPPIRGNLAFKYDTVEAEAAQICPIRFQGQWEDAETGLYYNRFRYYDPLAAQYISPDPIGLAGGMRSNAYVHNPNTWIDPWGLSRTPCCYPKDWFDNKTINKSGWYNNERDARNHARQMLGKNPVRIEQGKWRSQDGRWQYRAKEGDLMGHSPTDTRHVHIERLDPDTGYVITNYHLRW